jgi:hypothetical protein
MGPNAQQFANVLDSKPLAPLAAEYHLILTL